MLTISYVIINCGDGTNRIQWFNRAMTLAECDDLVEFDPSGEAYASGEGLQYYEMNFPDEFSVDGWAGINYITLEDPTKVIAEMKDWHTR